MTVTLERVSTKNVSSSVDDVYPALNPKSELCKYEDFCILSTWVRQRWVPLHPSQAVMLALFDGRASQEEIGRLWAYVYNQPVGDGLTMAEACVKKFERFLDLHTEPSDSPLHPFNPKDFIYNISDESVYKAAVFGDQTGDKFPIPVEISLNLTQRCNFKCEYCYTTPISEDSSKQYTEQWLNLPKVLALLEEAADLGTIYVAITGGEPTLFKGWMDVVLKTLELNMIPVMTTNGSVITCQQIETLASAGMKEITFSLDASLADLHHKITRTHNTFDRVTKAIKNSVEVGLHTNVKCVLTTSNYENIVELIDFVAELGVNEFGITYMEPGDRNSCSTKLNPQVEYADLLALRKVIMQKRQEYMGKCQIYPPKDIKQKYDYVPCGGLHTGMIINARGEVNICDKLISEKDFIYGDTYKYSLKEIWGSKEYQKLRDRTLDPLVIDPICRECSKLRLCRTGCYSKSLILTGNPFSKDPDCGGPY